MQIDDVFERIKRSAKLRIDWFDLEDGLIEFAGTENGSLIAENVLMEALGELALGETSSGGVFTAGVVRTSSRILCWNYGEYVVTNELEVTLQNSVLHCGWDKISNGKFKFEKVMLKGANNQPFKFGNANGSSGDTGHQYFYIGKGGLCFGSGVHKSLRYETGGEVHNSTVHINPWHGDYTIHAKDAADDNHDFYISTVSYFGTTDENGNACTVTADAIFNSGSDGAMHFDGKGTFVANAVNKCSCPVTVHGGSYTTLAINPGKKVTSGAITVNSKATLALPQAGVVTMAGALTLNAGSTLSFKLCRDNETTLDMGGNALTANATVNIKFAEGMVFTPGKKYTLISGANLELSDKEKFQLPTGVAGSLDVDDSGNLVYAAPKYLYIRLK